ncbi:hypothetical protein T492DRAFT_402291 [Pavlovales sp. CCMP2436]|nr:hypothetical protein T492DRAFT_402291 [Pavlovales sp. CCMP2436]
MDGADVQAELQRALPRRSQRHPASILGVVADTESRRRGWNRDAGRKLTNRWRPRARPSPRGRWAASSGRAPPRLESVLRRGGGVSEGEAGKQSRTIRVDNSPIYHRTNK